MCVGGVALLRETWDDGGSPVGCLDDGDTVSLAFVPAAAPGDYLLIHLGIPVEVLDRQTALEALGRRAHAATEEGDTP